MNDRVDARRLRHAGRRPGVLRDACITLSHGSGGRAMRDLIDDVFVGAFDNPVLAALEDQARIPIAELGSPGSRLAFTTDSYVVDPLFFPGGDIGSLAINGTVNDLAVGGARPLYLTCAMILEEGLDIAVLRRVARSMADAAQRAGVAIVTGDTKVVPRGAADKLFINTTGIGVIAEGVDIGSQRAEPGDVVIVNGTLGDHGATILAARGDLALEAEIASDCAPLHRLVAAMLDASTGIRCLRDATRGGVATVVNEIAQSSSVCIRLDEARLPVREPVAGLCELLGLDPLYMANEGKLVAVVRRAAAKRVLAAMRANPFGRDAAIIGEVVEEPCGVVTLATALGGERIVDMLVGEQLPRIC